MRFCASLYRYTRRKTRAVAVGDPAHGGVIISGDHPIVKQSMITADTADTEACANQTLELAAVGCELVRITVPTVSDAANLRAIAERVRKQGCLVPLVADVHFKPEAAFEAARWVEKVRINPGNYADSKKFAVKSYSDEQYAAELARIEQKFAPLVDFC
ncbi:MAG: flavodoxin-dependent (E)-4-hydroxy-3-methylbut-2-enyl-diphosphate synthase, partial [Verrucomicrobiia bacterium]